MSQNQNQNQNNSVLDKIRDILTALCNEQGSLMSGVYYGACSAHDLDAWNYFVFSRGKTRKATNGVDAETYYKVNVICEDFIPEGYVPKVVAALSDRVNNRTKLKLTTDDIDYDYTFKGNTDIVVEIATLTFVHPEKRC